MSARPILNGVECSLTLAPGANLQGLTDELLGVLLAGLAVFELLALPLTNDDGLESEAYYGGLNLLRQARELSRLVGSLAINTPAESTARQGGAA